MANRLEIKSGILFGKLKVLHEVDRIILPSGQTNRVFRCLCKCGTIKDVRLAHLNHGRVVSCGCYKNPRVGDKEKQYIRKIWRAIKYRTDKNYFESHLYYDKGVRMCREWLENYDSFERWAMSNGLKKGTHIDRIDSNGNYCEDNCRVVTPVVNANNKENTFYVEYDGIKKPFMILLRELDRLQDMSAIRSRIKRGWDSQKAIDTPLRKGNYRKLLTKNSSKLA